MWKSGRQRFRDGHSLREREREREGREGKIVDSLPLSPSLWLITRSKLFRLFLHRSLTNQQGTRERVRRIPNEDDGGGGDRRRLVRFASQSRGRTVQVRCPSKSSPGKRAREREREGGFVNRSFCQSFSRVPLNANWVFAG